MLPDRPWTADAAEVAASIDTDPAHGLGASEVEERRSRYGANELVERGRTPTWRLLLDQFTNAMIVVLLPILQPIFATDALSPVELAVVLVASTLAFVGVELEKWVLRRRDRGGGVA